MSPATEQNKTEQNKAIVRRWVEEAWNKGNLSMADELYAKEYAMHDPSAPPTMDKGPAGLKQFIRGFREALPDLSMKLESVIGEGNLVSWRFACNGTQKGTLLGIPPTGRNATVTGTVTTRFQDGKWSEDWVNWDLYGMLRQMGVIPA